MSYLLGRIRSEPMAAKRLSKYAGAKRLIRKSIGMTTKCKPLKYTLGVWVKLLISSLTETYS